MILSVPSWQRCNNAKVKTLHGWPLKGIQIVTKYKGGRKDVYHWILFSKIPISVSACCSLINRRCLDEQEKCCKFCWRTSPSPKPIVLAEITCLRQYISGIDKVDLICGFLGGLPDVTFSKSKLDAPIYWRCYSWEEHFVPALPICQDIAY